MNIINKWSSTIFICFMVGVALTAQGQEAYRQTAFVESKVVDSFSIGMRDQDGFTNSAPDRYLSFTIWCTNGTILVDWPPEPEYAYQVELLDTNGRIIPKTEMGKQVGKKFAEFHADAREKNIKTARMPVFVKGELAGWSLMFRPTDLFQIDKPGNYTLRIRFQIIALPNGSQRGSVRRLIRFPALDYPLVQPKLVNGAKP